ncbi:MAG: cytochrome c oxidase accessory protein CcoG [Burkholderiales bacterium]|nr:cytochrome c oxidase accessory protein CcoG [Burkholderiales bacterium]MDE2396189.1 cytochrome c oxidase accessory protein CcoG [Burkholderiales bacterium]
MYQKRPEIYARAVQGWFANWRWVFVWLTQLLFYGLPWIQWNGRQAVLFNLETQRFYIGPLVLFPQDLIFLAALLVLSALALFFFTALAGRLWCGYACPQTVYTEIFSWIERRIEGDRIARMRLDRAPWSATKVARKSAKQAGWVAFSLVTGFSFVGYFTPIRELAPALAHGTISGWNSFWVLFYGFATYANAGYVREQMCKYVCPYARFQSALIDADSLIITYDAARGEPRGSRSRKAVPVPGTLGDCVDCTMCVQVCPTGIDIRHGLQNECIGCAACIDACDDVMGRMGYAPGLIRYSTENGLRNGWSRAQMMARALRPRVLIYAGLLVVAASAFALSLAWRAPLLVDVIKDRGALGRMVESGAIENVYRVQVMNRSERPQRLRLSASGLPGIGVTAPVLEVPATGIASATVALRLPGVSAQALQGRVLPVTIELRPADAAAGSAALVREASTFVVPR